MILYTMRAKIQRSQVAALVYASLQSKDAALESLKMYEQELFPFLAPEKSEEKMKVRLMKEMARGPIAVKSTEQPRRKFRSSLLRKPAS